MPFTNQTPNYALPQYIATDHPTYLGDVNDAYLKIDSRMKANQDAAATNKSDLDLLSARVLANESGIDNRYTKTESDARYTSRPNLLDNGSFEINQRQESTYSGSNIMCVDRFRLYGSFNVAARTLTFQSANSVSIGGITMSYIGQLVYNAPVGSVVTMSARVGGTVYSATATVTSANVTYQAGPHYFVIGNNGSETLIAFGITSGAVVLDYLKAETGDVATPFIAKTRGEELAECMRYYYTTKGFRIRQMVSAQFNGACDVFGLFPVPMRAVPSLSFTGQYKKNATGATLNPLPAHSVNEISPTGFSAYFALGQANENMFLIYDYTVSAEP